MAATRVVNEIKEMIFKLLAAIYASKPMNLLKRAINSNAQYQIDQASKTDRRGGHPKTWELFANSGIFAWKLHSTSQKGVLTVESWISDFVRLRQFAIHRILLRKPVTINLAGRKVYRQPSNHQPLTNRSTASFVLRLSRMDKKSLRCCARKHSTGTFSLCCWSVVGGDGFHLLSLVMLWEQIYECYDGTCHNLQCMFGNVTNLHQ